MKLHYSQTTACLFSVTIPFYYLMKLHYSQTTHIYIFTICRFYYLMKLHYSQTGAVPALAADGFTTL